MRFYRVWRLTEGGNSHSFEFFTARVPAERDAREWRKIEGEEEDAGVDEIDIQPTKAGILHALNWLGSHADNG